MTGQRVVSPHIEPPTGFRTDGHVVEFSCIKGPHQDSDIDQALVHAFCKAISKRSAAVERNSWMDLLESMEEDEKFSGNQQFSASGSNMSFQISFAGCQLFLPYGPPVPAFPVLFGAGDGLLP